MSINIKFRIFVLAGLCFSLSACITSPGHRQVFEEDNFSLYIQAASKNIKNKIRFNTKKTDLVFLPENASVKLNVVDKFGKHQLEISNPNGTISYNYKLNGNKVIFGAKEKKWFASQVPKIISKANLEPS